MSSSAPESSEAEPAGALSGANPQPPSEDNPTTPTSELEPDGAPAPFLAYPRPLYDETGSLAGAINTLVDIADRKKTEDAALWLAAIVESSDDAIVSKDLNGIITTWNRGAARLFGYTAEETIGRPITILIPSDRHDEEPAILERIRRGERIEQYETIRQRKDGSLVDISLTVSPVKNAKGRIIGASKIARDITARKKAEAVALRLSAIVESSDDAIVSEDHNGIITTWNRGAERLFGYTAEEVIGKPVTILIPPDRIDERRGITEGICRGEHVDHYETVRQRKDGSLVDISLTVSPVKNVEGKVVGASKIARDISERKAAEEALRQTQEQLHVALTASDTGTFRWNPYTDKFLAFDENLKRLFGFAPGEPVRVTEDFITRVHPDDVPRLVAAINRCREGADFEMEFRVVHSDGSIHWLYDRAKMERDAEGNPTYLVGACTDVTQRTQSEYAARQTAQRFLFMAETMPQKIFTATAKGDVDYFNRQWLEFTGLALAQIRGWGWTQLIHPDDIEENIQVWKHSIETGEPFEFVHRVRRTDGAYRWHLSRARAMRDASGTISMWVGSTTEIHEQKEMAETLRQREEALRESEAHLRLVLDSAAEGFQGVDRDGVTTTCNAAFLRMLGFERAEDAVGKKLHDVIHHSHPDGSHYPREECPIYRTMRTGEAAHVDNELFFRLDGSSFPVEYWSYPILRDGEVQGAVTTFIDVTERKQAEEQQRLLLREMNHRIGNLFALASAVTTLSARFAATPKDLADAVQDRLVALARAHNLTLRAIGSGEAKPNLETTLSEVVGTIIAPYTHQDRATAVISGPDVPIKGKSVMSAALLLHEIATNATKYGALSSPGGHVEVSWSVQQNELLLTWRERGGPPINGPPKREGFGSLLTRLAVSGQLGGKLSHEWNQEGLTVHLSAPLDRLVN